MELALLCNSFVIINKTAEVILNLKNLKTLFSFRDGIQNMNKKENKIPNIHFQEIIQITLLFLLPN